MHHEEEGGEKDLLDGGGDSKDEEFAIVFAAMGVNMETAHFFKQARNKHDTRFGSRRFQAIISDNKSVLRRGHRKDNHSPKVEAAFTDSCPRVSGALLKHIPRVARL